ncbi:hypothetical protein tb265_30060 [Gemmatimonadetes bacterium T265]|nr:hypothetical protein tb265_30060 [Gemmatimonadetes bacterium T265]
MALDRTAMERVLARAAELQTAAGAGDEPRLSDAELLDAAREAGLSLDHVRAALAEERLRAAGPRAVVPADAGDAGDLAGRLAGPEHAGAARLVAGAPAAAVDALGRWLEREECMRLARRAADANGVYAAWDARTDFVGQLTRGLRRGGGTPGLRRARGVRAVALPADAGRTLLRLELDLGGARRQRLTAGGVAAAGGVLAGGGALGVGVVAHAMLAVVAPVAVLPVLAGGAAAWAIARGHREAVARGTVALETLLDRVEGELAAGAGPAGAVGAGGVRSAAGLLDAIEGVRRALR